jgi:hypothetical protein
MITSEIWFALSPDLSRAAFMATDPSCGAVNEESEPMNAPMGVRAAESIYDDMKSPCDEKESTDEEQPNAKSE